MSVWTARALLVNLLSFPCAPQSGKVKAAPAAEVRVRCDPKHTPKWLESVAVEVLGLRFAVESRTGGSYVPGRFYGSALPVFSLTLSFREDLLASDSGRAAIASAVRIVVSAAQLALEGRKGRV
jgi:hypothetical protein